MSKKSKQQKLHDLKRLQERLRSDANSTNLNRSKSSDFQFFVSAIRAYTKARKNALYSLWYHTAGFRSWWCEYAEDDREVFIMTECLKKGMSRDAASRIIEAWWDWHRARPGTSQVFLDLFYRKAEPLARPALEKVQQEKERQKAEASLDKTKTKVYNALTDEPKSAKEIAAKLGMNAGTVKKQLVRMAGKEIQRVGRGLYARPGKPKPARKVEAPTPSGEDEILFSIGEQTRGWTAQEYFAFKDSPQFEAWRDRIRDEYWVYFEHLKNEQTEEIDDEDDTGSKAKLPF